MKIYDEKSGAEITAPDESKGYLYAGRRVVEHVEEATEIMPGTVTAGWPQGLKRIVPAHDVYEDCQYYHAYTAEELAERSKPTVQQQLADAQDKLAALTAVVSGSGENSPGLQEQVDANAAAIAELAAMLAGGDA